jgi:hypothetical protein
MTEFHRIEAMSLGRLLAIIYAVGGLVAGAFLSLIAIMEASFLGDLPLFLGFFFGAAAFFVLPIVYGLFGFAGGVIIGWLYNLIARVAGGLRVELRDVG